MNRWQKIAWCYVITISIGIVASIIAISILYAKTGMPTALKGFSFIGIGGLGAISQLIFKKEKVKFQFDERDRLFHQRAWFIGYGASYTFFVVVNMSIWFIYGPEGSVSVNVLPFTVCIGVIVLALAHSVAILEQYGWRSKGGKS